MKRLLLLLTLTLLSCTHAKELKVPFVGNSYTYVCAMPEILKAMAEANGHELDYEQQTPGGRNFQQHWEAGKAAEIIKGGTFDCVVLQNQSFEPVGDPENMMKYGKLLAAEADKSGAEKLYYLTMTYKGPLKWMKEDSENAHNGMALFPTMQDRLAESYTRLAKETGGSIAPVGIAWQLAYESEPSLKLHAGDLSHPAPHGAYLTALVFYFSLYGDEFESMPQAITVKARKKGELLELKITVNTATQQLLIHAAKEACKSYPMKTNGQPANRS